MYGSGSAIFNFASTYFSCSFLQVELNKANAEKQAAIDLVEDGQRRLSLAKRLTSALADENVRWAEGIESLTRERTLLIGDVLIARCVCVVLPWLCVCPFFYVHVCL